MLQVEQVTSESSSRLIAHAKLPRSALPTRRFHFTDAFEVESVDCLESKSGPRSCLSPSLGPKSLNQFYSLKQFFFMKHLSLLTMALCALVSTSFAQYTLTVDTATAVDPALGTTYRYYVNLEDATDQVSAIFGNNQGSLSVDAPNGVFNSAFNASWNASGINPAFLATFPELAADTYATIGLEGPASSSGIAGAADPSIVEDGAQPITPFFLTDGATSLLSNSLIGASWFVLNTAANASPLGGDLRVLVMQVTSTGDVTGQLNYSVFPNGIGEDSRQYLTPFEGIGTFQGQLFEEIVGCMDEAACNFDPCANIQPVAFCNYPNANGDCD